MRRQADPTTTPSGMDLHHPVKITQFAPPGPAPRPQHPTARAGKLPRDQSALDHSRVSLYRQHRQPPCSHAALPSGLQPRSGGSHPTTCSPWRRTRKRTTLQTGCPHRYSGWMAEGSPTSSRQAAGDTVACVPVMPVLLSALRFRRVVVEVRSATGLTVRLVKALVGEERRDLVGCRRRAPFGAGSPGGQSGWRLSGEAARREAANRGPIRRRRRFSDLGAAPARHRRVPPLWGRPAAGA
jgi:hypothetical protein